MPKSCADPLSSPDSGVTRLKNKHKWSKDKNIKLKNFAEMSNLKNIYRDQIYDLTLIYLINRLLYILINSNDQIQHDVNL